jgi:hypothetical protein|tara:strand:- start:691 stop:819 length:129 start_codon:yes stop_codon:yes gene_type:complete
VETDLVIIPLLLVAVGKVEHTQHLLLTQEMIHLLDHHQLQQE